MTVRHQPSAAAIAAACLVLALGIWAAAFCSAPVRPVGSVTPTPQAIAVTILPTVYVFVSPTLPLLVVPERILMTPTTREPTTTRTPTPVPSTATETPRPATPTAFVQRG